MARKELDLPSHFDEDKVSKVWPVDYQAIAAAAQNWARRNRLAPAAADSRRVSLLLVDCQNSFCTPGFELYVAGRSGVAAVEDSGRIAKFLYRNLQRITVTVASLDTHSAMQIFHPLFLLDDQGNHPPPYTEISLADVEKGKWKVNPAAVESSGGRDLEALQNYLLHYCRTLAATGKYQLMIWPYHAMVGGIGHSLVSAIAEALFFHSVARQTQTRFVLKGQQMLTENYSILGPEVTRDETGKEIAAENEALFSTIVDSDMVIIAGQAKSHCVVWTIEDLLERINASDPKLARRIFLLEDCTSPVVIPGGIDFTDRAQQAFERFATAGVHLVTSTDPIDSWLDSTE